ncbi:MAG TPA: DUF882 domain-containing protein [Polyangiaceae bacterium]|nr:DUF882 domain-containing protein [Polyangiaceae bacterium]
MLGRTRVLLGMVLGFALTASVASPLDSEERVAVAAPLHASAMRPALHDEARRTSASPDSSSAPPLWPLRITHVNTQRSETIALYDDELRVDACAAARLDALLCDARDPDEVHTTLLDRRTLQLVYRAAYHFGVKEVQVVSAYRRRGRRREGLHAQGRAIDFKLPGVPAATLAAYLRKLPRVGVGVYTHPKTQYVHLDDRVTSYHWLDASPPGRSWRERTLRSPSAARRDAAYSPADDLPESAQGATATAAQG